MQLIQRILDSEYHGPLREDAPPRVMMQLGDFTFSIDELAYNSMKTDFAWSWAEQGRIGKQDLLQYTGKSAPTRTLDGEAHASLGSSIGALKSLSQLGDLAQPLLMVSGYGDVLGYWVVVSVSSNTRTFLPGGSARHATFSMTLKFYGYDLSNP